MNILYLISTTKNIRTSIARFESRIHSAYIIDPDLAMLVIVFFTVEIR